MRWLIDSNCCIYLFADSHPKLTARVEQAAVGEIGMSAIVYAELMLGAARGGLPRPEILERLIEQMPFLPFDLAAARSYGRLPFRRGRFDRLLAAQALSLGLTVITNNERDFMDIPGLAVENWTL